MSSLKTLFVAAFLVAGLYGVYLALNYTPDQTADTGVAEEWKSSIDVNMGTPDSGSSSAPSPQWNSDASSSPAPSFPSAMPSANPPAAASPGMPAPQFNQNSPSPSSGMTSAAPADPNEPQFPTPISPEYGSSNDQNQSASASGWPAENSPSANPVNTPQPANSFDYGTPMPATHGGVAPANREDHAVFMQRVSEALAARRLAEAHLMLSERYTDPNTTPDEKRQLQGLLDQLAGTVIYSPTSYLEAPYEVLANDTLKSIAEKHFVPVGLLAKINSLNPNVPLRPGQQIKVVSGPFEAVIDRDLCELTLLLRGERYAGRFPIGIGPELRQDGAFMVTDKKDLVAAAADGSFPTDGSLGTRWIGLGQHMGLHGTNQPGPFGRPVQQGCISLGQRDIEDLYDILSIGSTIVIRR